MFLFEHNVMDDHDKLYHTSLELWHVMDMSYCQPDSVARFCKISKTTWWSSTSVVRYHACTGYTREWLQNSGTYYYMIFKLVMMIGAQHKHESNCMCRNVFVS